MNPRGESILEGPRGRRLCLELAKELDPGIVSAVYPLAKELNPGMAGAAYTLASGLLPTHRSQAVPTTRDSVDSSLTSALERLSASISSLDLSGLDTHRLQLALGPAIDSVMFFAMYVQEPDGDDVLAGLPIIRSALAPLAEYLASSPITAWFDEPRQAEQWAIEWQSDNAPPALPKDPRKTLRRWALDARAEEQQAARERPQHPHADWGGTWWSIPLGLITTLGRLPAGLSLVEDSLGWEHARAIPVRGTGRTFEIRSEQDWISLCRDFPLEVTASRRHDWFRTTGRDGRWVIPDWEQVAGEWDAVHLTPWCYLRWAGRILHVDTDTASMIAGFDPGSTIWLTDVADESDGPCQDWRLDAHDDTWILTL